MSGIVGLVGRLSDVHPLNPLRSQGVLAAISHRGPDAQGDYSDRNVWLGHVRLSVLDLSSVANQPMTSTDGRYAISYNGQVYNFRELASELSLYNLRSRSDTEVVLRAFEKIGLSSLVKLNGMFAFALYDKQDQKLWLVRDRLGIKPLYYRLDSHCLAFASEIKGILALNEDTLSCDIASLHEWLYYGNTLGGRTLYHGITQLRPGHYLELDLNSFQHVIHEYWSLSCQAELKEETFYGKSEIIEETRRLLENAVKRQLISDVPVGLFLSGGVDSSAVAAFASRHYGRRLATYSAGFDFARDGGELPKAKLIAKLFGTDHHEIHIAGSNVGDVVEKMVKHHDMPFSDAANIPLYLMASQISAQTKVVLQGDGADELFGGYRRYSTLTFYRWLHQMAIVLQHLHHVMPKSAFYYRVQRYLHAFAAEDLGATMALLLTSEDQKSKPSEVFAPQLRLLIEQSDPFARYRECQKMFSAHSIGNQMSFIDLMIILPDTYLEKADRSTMAASLEVRAPFLDNDLVDFVVGIPGHLKTPFGKKKWLLKSALEGIVPDEILYGPKTGFNVPFEDWLRTSLKPLFFDHLSKFMQENPEVLNTDYLKMLLSRTECGMQDHSFMIWKIFNFMIWVNNTKIRII